MSLLDTPLCGLLGVRYPFVQAPMANTAVLLTREVAVPREHLEALRSYETGVTDAYTGRPMGAAHTPVLAELMAGPPPLAFPDQRALAAAKGPLYMGGTGEPEDENSAPASSHVCSPPKRTLPSEIRPNPLTTDSDERTLAQPRVLRPRASWVCACGVGLQSVTSSCPLPPR